VADTVVFLDANTLASPVTRTLLIAGGRADGLLLTWSAHVEAEADRHARGASSRTSVVRRAILGMELSKSARTTEGLLTTAPEDRQVIADAIRADAQYRQTTTSRECSSAARSACVALRSSPVMRACASDSAPGTFRSGGCRQSGRREATRAASSRSGKLCRL